MEGLGGQNNPAREIWAQKEKIAWSIRVSIPVPRACKARTLPIELIPQAGGQKAPPAGFEPATPRFEV